MLLVLKVLFISAVACAVSNDFIDIFLGKSARFDYIQEIVRMTASVCLCLPVTIVRTDPTLAKI